ncbi:MAG: hypothetical protein P4L96_03535 [Rhodoferax sp.]|nr:hypothetical protein [Rhodoferax sp.]
MAATIFAGPWRIVWMSGWDQDYVDMDVPGHITFENTQSGSFQFGMVQGQMDCRLDKRQSQRVEFTWNGFDEGDELAGQWRRCASPSANASPDEPVLHPSP